MEEQADQTEDFETIDEPAQAVAPLSNGNGCVVIQAHTILPADHPIVPEMIDQDALFILRKLSDAGFCGYLVGGGVRDLYLGKKPKDFDISTNARPGQLRKLFPNSNTIGRRFRLVQVFFRGGKTIEVSTLRSLSEHDLDGPELVLAPNNTFGTLSEDARRRDLTINSLFYELESGAIIDYVDGIKDLDAGVIRIVGDPEKRIARDPVRSLRAIRHAARNGFTIEPLSWDAVCDGSSKLSLCPPSRLRDELLKDVYSGAFAPWLSLAIDSGAFGSLFPLYRPLIDKKLAGKLPVRVLLERLGEVIDRINNLAVERQVHRQPDYFFFTLLLLPWAEYHYQLLSTPRKGNPLFQIGREIRNQLDHTIGVHLNLRRSLRQEVVSLLTSLAQLHNNRKNNSWPNWLRKKSYFKKAVLLYHVYREATGSGAVPESFFPTSNAAPRPEPPVQPHGSEEEPNYQPRYKPAFSRKAKGGIFGFKK